MSDENLSPAEKRLREEGGVIMPGPEEFTSTGTQVDPEDPAETIDARSLGLEIPEAPGRAPVPSPSFDVSKGLVRPEDSPMHGMSAGDRAYHQSTAHRVNVEMNLFATVFRAVRNFVNEKIRSEPPDSAELGQSMFGPGQRTPLEQSEPYIAIEVYREVKRSMRLARRGRWGRFWDWFTGKGRDDDEEPTRRPQPDPPQKPKTGILGE